MLPDILTREDVVVLVDAFYAKVMKDDLLNVYFVHHDLGKLMPTMYNFWENIILFSGDYAGNPMESHKHVNEAHHLNSQTFEHWMQLFKETLNEHFSGDNTNLALQRATSISQILLQKMHA
jgi:hemoglobin